MAKEDARKVKKAEKKLLRVKDDLRISKDISRDSKHILEKEVRPEAKRIARSTKG